MHINCVDIVGKHLPDISHNSIPIPSRKGFKSIEQRSLCNKSQESLIDNFSFYTFKNGLNKEPYRPRLNTFQYRINIIIATKLLFTQIML